MYKRIMLAGFALGLCHAMPAMADDFILSSSSIAEGQPLTLDQVYKGCGGKNISPELKWSGAPEGTKSFAITAYDPDAPTGSGWWHWMVVNVPADVHNLAQGASGTDAMPKGAQELKTDFGQAGFGGACPPPGKMHRYEFTVYALDTAHMDVPEGAGNAAVGFAIHAHALAQAKITAVYTSH